MNRLWFLKASCGNLFMNELLDALGRAAARTGADVAWASDAYPEPEAGDAYVVIPHEFFECAPDAGRAAPGQLARTVALCVEQPGTSWFEISLAYARRLGRTLDIHQSACSELTRRGIPAEHLQLGYAPEWDWWKRTERPRPVDVLFLGSEDDRRAGVLGGLAEALAPRTTRLMIPPLGPKPLSAPNFLTGSDKYRQLAASRLLINIHRSNAAGLFEWMRALEAICNGCVVLSEHSVDHAPLVPGEHFVSGRSEHLDLLALGLLENHQRLDQVRQSAYEFVRSELTMDAGIAALLDAADAACRTTRGSAITAAPALPETPLTQSAQPSPVQVVEAAMLRQLAPLKSALKALTLDALGARRRLEALEHGLHPGSGRRTARIVTETESYAACRPRVSVLISLHNYEREVVEALKSVVRSEHSSYEVLVLDDASTDRSLDTVAEFLSNHAWLPGALFSWPANLGLAATRNALIRRARGEFVFILDADNAIFPSTLSRLEEPLVRSPGASFAYGMSVVAEGGKAVGLNSVGLWNPARLAIDNYIDAMALIRRRALDELGGYAEDIRLTGWEDYDLWLRMAERGMHPIHVPEVIGRYRRSGHSMLAAITNIDADVARSVIRSRSPGVFMSPSDRGPAAQLLAEPAGTIELGLDEPASDTVVSREQVLVVSGWAASKVGVERVSVQIAGTERKPHRGLVRLDVAARYPLFRDADRSGFKLVVPVSEVPPGRHDLVVTARGADGHQAVRRATVDVGPRARAARVADSPRGAEAPAGDSLELWILARTGTATDLAAAADDIARTSAAIDNQTVRPCATCLVSGARCSSTIIRHVPSLQRALHDLSPAARYVIIVRAGDEPYPDAIARVAEAIGDGHGDVIYGDDDVLSDVGPADPFHKPAWSPELQAALDYVGPFAAIHAERLSRAIARHPDASGAGELVSGLLDDPRLRVRHIPRILCTRMDREDASTRDRASDLTRAPLVSVVIPTAARGGHLERCLRSLAARSTHERLEIVIVDSSGGALPDVEALAAPLPVRVARYDRPFNYSSAVNAGARLARGEYLVLLNDDVEVISADWVERMLEQALRPGVGIVGAKLVRSNGTIQHGGVFLHAGSADHLFDFFVDDGDGYHGLLGVPRNCSAVTAACLMISAGLFNWLGGLDEAFVLDYGDTDLCLRAADRRQRVVWTPDAVMRHDGRSSRGTESPPTDLQILRKYWAALMDAGDPYYNPNLAVRPQFEPLATAIG